MIDLAKINIFEKVRSKINEVVSSANADIFANNDYTVPYNTTLRVIVALDADSVLKYKQIRGTDTVIQELNSGNVLKAKAAYGFDIPFLKDDKVNFQISPACTLLRLDILKMRFT